MRVRYSFGSRHTGKLENIEKQRRKFPDIVEEIVEISDIILEVLDSRFIEETRNLEVEEEILARGKVLVYVLNKCDLIGDFDALDKKKAELKKLKLYPHVFISCTNRIGATSLRNRIKMEAKRIVLPKEDMKRVQVGIIGYPNTGKSSLINFLTGRSSARVGAEAGFTKGIQKIKLNDQVLILDTPGVIPDKEYSTKNMDAITKHAKVSARDATKVRDPEYVVSVLMKEYAPQIESFYGVKVEGDSEKLIELIGQTRNMLRKGGIVDEDRAARVILKDWQEGKIKI